MSKLREILIRHEGLMLKPYLDSEQKLTIGVGRNLEDVGLTHDEAITLLENDIQSAAIAANRYRWYYRLNEPRQVVIVCMIFNMGPGGFASFKKMHQALESQNYPKAADEMLDSKWAKQVKSRAVELASIMVNGQFLDPA